MDFKKELSKLGYNKGDSIDVDVLISEILPKLFFNKENYTQLEMEDIIKKTVYQFCYYFSNNLREKVANDWIEKIKKK